MSESPQRIPTADLYRIVFPFESFGKIEILGPATEHFQLTLSYGAHNVPFLGNFVELPMHPRPVPRVVALRFLALGGELPDLSL